MFQNANCDELLLCHFKSSNILCHGMTYSWKVQLNTRNYAKYGNITRKNTDVAKASVKE